MGRGAVSVLGEKEETFRLSAWQERGSFRLRGKEEE